MAFALCAEDCNMQSSPWDGGKARQSYTPTSTFSLKLLLSVNKPACAFQHPLRSQGIHRKGFFVPLSSRLGA